MEILKNNGFNRIKQPEYRQTLPKFNLKSTKNIYLKSDDLFKENGLIVIFTCNHCPYAKAIWNR